MEWTKLDQLKKNRSDLTFLKVQDFIDDPFQIGEEMKYFSLPFPTHPRNIPFSATNNYRESSPFSFGCKRQKRRQTANQL